MAESTSQRNSTPNYIRALPRLLLLVVLLWILSCVLMVDVYGLPKSSTELSDSFGALNTLFSGLAFACVIYAIFLQREELKLQREELKLTRVELVKTSDTALRAFHLDLMRMPIDDPELHDVWHFSELQTHKDAKQHTYVSVILNYWSLLFGNRLLSEAQLRTAADSYMKTPIFRAFWARTRVYRKQLADGGNKDDRVFHSAFEDAYQAGGEPGGVP